MKKFMAITKALADENRVRILLALVKQDLCVCQITELLKLAPSTVSKHLSILSQAGLIKGRKIGKWVHYKLVGNKAPAEVRGVLNWIQSTLCKDPLAIKDSKILEKILKIPPEELCKEKCC